MSRIIEIEVYSDEEVKVISETQNVVWSKYNVRGLKNGLSTDDPFIVGTFVEDELNLEKDGGA